MAGVSPTVRQRERGKRLRALRNGYGLTVEEVAARLLCSSTKISRVETVARRPSLRGVRDLCALYNVSPQETTELMNLAREARLRGWWTQQERRTRGIAKSGVPPGPGWLGGIQPTRIICKRRAFWTSSVFSFGFPKLV